MFFTLRKKKFFKELVTENGSSVALLQNPHSETFMLKTVVFYISYVI